MTTEQVPDRLRNDFVAMIDQLLLAQAQSKQPDFKATKTALAALMKSAHRAYLTCNILERT